MIRTIHTFWDGPGIPDYVTDYIRAWHDLHPGWTVQLWNDESALSGLPFTDELRDLYMNNERYSPKSNKYQYRTNIARVLMLHTFGGLWVDADLKPLKNIEPLIDGAQVAVGREDSTFCNNGFMYADEPGASFFTEYLELLPGRIKSNPHLRSNRQCGPHLVTELVAKHQEVRIIPNELLYPYSWNELHLRGDEFPDAYTVHLWRNAMTREGLL